MAPENNSVSAAAAEAAAAPQPPSILLINSQQLVAGDGRDFRHSRLVLEFASDQHWYTRSQCRANEFVVNRKLSN